MLFGMLSDKGENPDDRRHLNSQGDVPDDESGECYFLAFAATCADEVTARMP